MRVIAGSCPNGNCPKIVDLGTGEVDVQGDLVDAATPAGEGIVRLPASYILEAADALRAEAAR